MLASRLHWTIVPVVPNIDVGEAFFAPYEDFHASLTDRNTESLALLPFLTNGSADLLGIMTFYDDNNYPNVSMTKPIYLVSFLELFCVFT